MFESIRESVGRAIQPDRLGDTEGVSTPDQEINPESWQNEATPGLGERIKRAKRQFILYGFILVAATGVLLVWARQFLWTTISNPIVQGGVAFAATGALAFYTGASWQRERINDIDWLVLMLPDGATAYLGEYESAPDGTTVFTPYRGFDWLGFKSRQLRLGELGEEIARTYAKADRDMDSPVRIRVDDALTETKDTAFGHVIVSLTGGLEVDGFGQHSDVYTSPPSRLDEETARELRQKLREFAEQMIPNLQNQLRMAERQRDHYRQRLEESGEEEIDRFVDRFVRVQQATMAGENNQTGEDAGDSLEDDPLLNAGSNGEFAGGDAS